MEYRFVSYSRLETRYRPQPGDANPFGVMHGGKILYHMDTATGMTANRHAGGRAVTASIERMDFISPVEMGENLLIKTSVNMAHRSSMEIGARIEAENPFTGETRHVGTAYVIYVALDKEGNPTPAPALMPETDDDRRRLAEAVKRRDRRRKEREEES